MPLDPSDPPRKTFRGDRRAPHGRTGSVRWVKGLLGRPLTLERRGVQLHLALVDRRRPPEVVEADELKALRAEIRARLLENDNQHASAVMRHLVLVHDVLGRKGWAGVGALASRVLHKAQIQAQMLASERPSRRLTEFCERLTLLQAAASLREDQGRSPGAAVEPEVDTTPLAPPPEGTTRVDLEFNAPVDVSEGSTEDYDAAQREWVETVAQAADVDLPAPPESTPTGRS